MDTVPVTLSQSGDLTCKEGEAVGYGMTSDTGEFYGPTHKRTGKDSATQAARKTTLRLHSAKTCDEIHNHLYRQALASNNQDLDDCTTVQYIHPLPTTRPRTYCGMCMCG